MGKINAMRRILLLATVCACFMGCGGKKDNKDNAGTGFTDTEFTRAFPLLNLKFQITDSVLQKNNAAEKPLVVAGKNFFPDSLVTAFFGKGSKPKFYPIGKAVNGDKEIYLVMKGVNGNQYGAFLLCYDDKMNYKDGLLLCANDSDPKTYASATIDKSFNIVIRNELYHSSEDIQVTERALIYNSEGFFMDVLNNDSEKKQAMVNPLDTLSSKGKFSGDYAAADARNFISIRDGKDSSLIEFFYHFEKGEGCNKEIKDNATINSKNTALFRKDGDPCVLTFSFSNNQLTVKEEQGCGNYRGLNCTLNGVFTKLKKKATAADSAKKAPAAPLKNKPVAKPAVKTPAPVKKAPVKYDDVH